MTKASQTTIEPEGRDDLPEGWTQILLGQAVDTMKNGLYKPANAYASDGVACLRMYNIDGGKIVWKDIKRMRLSRDEIEEYSLAQGDLLVNRVNSRELVGKTAVIPAGLETCVYESKNIRVRLIPELVYPELVNYRLLYAGQQHFNFNSQQVVGMASISQPQIAAFPFPLPPAVEQGRIVDNVEQLETRVSLARERLTKVPKILKAFRQSVLATACSGRLTEDWREKQPDVQSASRLLAAILSKRQIRIEGNRSSNPVQPDAESLPDVPESWQIASMDQLMCLVTSGSRGWAKYYSEAGPSFIRAENINTDRLCMDNAAHLQLPGGAEGQRTRVTLSDLLVTITGANVTKSALVNIELKEAYVSQHVALVRPVDSATAPYLYLWIVSPTHGRAKLTADAYGAGKPGLNLDNIREMSVALPPLEEQHEIVRRVEALFKLADKIAERVAAATKRADKLTQAILAKAFRGDLVPTEAELARKEGRTYEPASALLARIKSERETAAAAAGNGTPRLRKAPASRK